MKPTETKVRRVGFGFTLGLMLLVGCANVNATSPLDCREIIDVPGLDEELQARTEDDNVLQQLHLHQLTKQLRDYVVESSAKCHGNKKLR